MNHNRLISSLCCTLLFLVITNCKKESENVVLSPDGVEIRYEVQGEGEPALVFVHGWCCDRTYWDAQETHFTKTHRVVTIDLAGHGESGQNRTNWTIKAFGDDVAAAINGLDLKRVVLIGHSLGGLVILETAQTLSDRVEGVVLVDEIFNVEMQYPQEVIDGLLEPFRNNFSKAMYSFVSQYMFAPESDADVIEKIATDMSLAPPEIGLGSIGGEEGYIDYFNNNALPALQALQCPIVFINSESEPTEVEINTQHVPSLTMKTMSGVGHFIMIEDPETFNRLLGESIRDIGH